MGFGGIIELNQPGIISAMFCLYFLVFLFICYFCFVFFNKLSFDRYKRENIEGNTKKKGNPIKMETQRSYKKELKSNEIKLRSFSTKKHSDWKPTRRQALNLTTFQISSQISPPL